jgi:hypothetical protein
MTTSTKKRTIIIIVLVALAILMIPLLFVGRILFELDHNDRNLNSALITKQNALSQIQVLDNTPTVAVGSKNGDALTGNVDSVSATATFTVQGTAADNLSVVSRNLAQSGFIPEGKLTTSSRSSGTVTYLVQKYQKANNTIDAMLKLTKEYQCPTPICGYTGSKVTEENEFDANTLSREPVSQLLVTYQ